MNDLEAHEARLPSALGKSDTKANGICDKIDKTGMCTIPVLCQFAFSQHQVRLATAVVNSTNLFTEQLFTSICHLQNVCEQENPDLSQKWSTRKDLLRFLGNRTIYGAEFPSTKEQREQYYAQYVYVAGQNFAAMVEDPESHEMLPPLKNGRAILWPLSAMLLGAPSSVNSQIRPDSLDLLHRAVTVKEIMTKPRDNIEITLKGNFKRKEKVRHMCDMAPKLDVNTLLALSTPLR